jgi:poly-gamma-glutamate capsule biosynthesis protein CapA/YwtB (metallophosphatase superfamily)
MEAGSLGRRSDRRMLRTMYSRRGVLLAGLASAATAGLAGGCRSQSRQTIELWVGGDVHLGHEAAGGKLAALAPLVAGATGIVNLEGPIGEPEPGDNEIDGAALVNAPSALSGLGEQGVKVIGIANNHAMDRGSEGEAATIAALSHEGLVPAGRSAGTARLDAGSTRLVVTAHDLASSTHEQLAADLDAARIEGEVMVATFHVTGPPSYLPTGELRQAVELAVRMGAKLVVAHGSHAIGPLERRGDAIIAWGLGNLLFSCPCTDEVDGLVIRATIEAGRARALVFPIDAGLRGEPVRLGHDPKLCVDLLEALGSSPLTREAYGASL